ncbi:anti-sigma factor [Desulfosporosinus sp.]|uniref:anti-sigma factor family protein n=1 Tax=Desulfosporosinus sp. TaxID=157907 RepID=UPI0025BEABB1|nr:zf-HC2 domain-containing protein [Desulfosporosinus sp.]MBC2726604.1 zf-HC2 domain-containing protein [Desulfosporosinus sp.]
MTCYRSRDNWHSYVKHSLSKAELDEMASHLAHCSKCRSTVAIIKKTLDNLTKKQVILNPPADLKMNVMKAIDKSLYLNNLVSLNSFRLFELKTWGFSMIATGIFLFALNLAALNPNFEGGKMIELPSILSKQMTIPINKISQLANDTFEKIESDIDKIKGGLTK